MKNLISNLDLNFAEQQPQCAYISLIRVQGTGRGTNAGSWEESVKLSAHFCKYNFGDKRTINDMLRVTGEPRVLLHAFYNY